MEDDEMKFLRKNYPHLAAVNGSTYLAKRLNEILINHIKKCLPQLVTRVHDKTAENKRKLVELGETFTDPNSAVVKTVTQFTQNFNELTYNGNTIMVMEKRSPAARISFIFDDKFPNEINGLNPLEGVSGREVNHFLRNATGLNPHVFIPPTAFTSLLCKQILRIVEPSLEMVDKIKDELVQTVKDCNVGGIYDRFPMLKTRIQIIVEDELEMKVEETKSLIQNYIESESEYINTRHKTFDTFYKKLYRREFEKRNAPPPEEQNQDPDDLDTASSEDEDAEQYATYDGDKRNVRLIKKLVPAYYTTVKSNVKDAVPKLIVKNMIKHLHTNLTPLLMEKMHRAEDVE
ncbi:unnamed protein product [Bursaphelenchus okinawaensis]|uniref:GED domain-containing protein n=1 Tax=Bursaphelenchus okinawaensis TaxID=465554 RepID=A0A811KFC6_9BILA|nr:unnamed protein product [Bursaphelenchus okinawaensis]CAG9102880.1 unnamed protein product [Bursaphelenchus okinawaensis]